MKQNTKVMVWGGMTGRGPTKLHMLPTGETSTSEYYINQILEKEVKPPRARSQVTGGPIERKLFSSKKEMTFVQDGAPAHTSKATRTLQHGVKRNCQILEQKMAGQRTLPISIPLRTSQVSLTRQHTKIHAPER